MQDFLLFNQFVIITRVLQFTIIRSPFTLLSTSSPPLVLHSAVRLRRKEPLHSASVADPGSGAFVAPGSGIRPGEKVSIRIRDPG
jgi:hypothetical protein